MNITEMNIGFLNSLNTFLIATEEKIIAKAKVQLPLLESKLRGIGSDTTDYEYFVEIDYFTDASNGNPIYYLTHAFTVMLNLMILFLTSIKYGLTQKFGIKALFR